MPRLFSIAILFLLLAVALISPPETKAANCNFTLRAVPGLVSPLLDADGNIIGNKLQREIPPLSRNIPANQQWVFFNISGFDPNVASRIRYRMTIDVFGPINVTFDDLIVRSDGVLVQKGDNTLPGISLPNNPNAFADGKNSFSVELYDTENSSIKEPKCDGSYTVEKADTTSSGVTDCKITASPTEPDENSDITISGKVLPKKGSTLAGSMFYTLRIEGPQRRGLDQFAQDDEGNFSQNIGKLTRGDYTIRVIKQEIGGTPPLTETQCTVGIHIGAPGEPGGTKPKECFVCPDGFDEKSCPTGTDTKTVCCKVDPADSTKTISAKKLSCTDAGGKPGTGTLKGPTVCTGNSCAQGAGQGCGDPVTNAKTGVITYPGVLTAIGCVPTDPSKLVQGLLTFATAAAGGIALLLMGFGALQMITSAGNPDNLKKGQQQFTSAIMGLLFIIFSVLLLQIIGVDLLGLPGFG